MHTLLNPRSVAVVGVSESSLWSQGFVKNLKDFDGDVHFVHPTKDTAFGRSVSPRLQDIGAPVDHAAILVSAARVPDVLRDAAAAGIRSATVIASGFGEGDGSGADLAREVASISAEHDMAVIGPNCYGFNNYAGTYISRYSRDVPSMPGRIGLSFQSGQLGGATADAASARGIHLRYVVSSGNELVVDTNDFLEYFLADDEIRVLGGVFERIPEPERFERIARAALDAGKPIVALKPGRSAAASRIAVAHTGSVTGGDAVTDAFLADLGIIRVSSVEELAETAGLLDARGWPAGGRTVFFGFSGGAAELFADEAHGTSIEIEPYSADLLASLAEVSTLPEAVIHNPFDMTIDGALHFARIADALAASGEFDVLISQGQPRRSFETALEPGEADPVGHFLSHNVPALFDVADRHDLFATFLETSDHQPGIGVFDRVHHPPDAHWVLGRNGVAAISNAIDYGAHRARHIARRDVVRIEPDRETLPDLAGREGSLDETTSKRLIRAYGVPVTEDVLALTPADAAAAADRLGYPVVLKVAADLDHKSEAGGVVLGLSTADDVRAAFERVVTSVRTHAPDAAIDGVIVARQVSGGSEFIAGITSDPHLGPVVVAGLGGIYVEVLKDVVLLRPPFDAADALESLRRLKSWPILAGARGRAPLDVSAFADALVGLGQLALDERDRLVELDVNPVFVLPEGHGVIAADALAVLGPRGSADG